MSGAGLRSADAASLYGEDGRPAFFQDPAMSRFVSVLLNLASELWVQTERVADLSALIVRKNLASTDELAALARESENSPEREAELRAYIDRVLGALREPRAEPQKGAT